MVSEFAFVAADEDTFDVRPVIVFVVLIASHSEASEFVAVVPEWHC